MRKIVALMAMIVLIGCTPDARPEQSPTPDPADLVEAETEQMDAQHSNEITDELLAVVTDTLKTERERASGWEERYHELVMHLVEEEEPPAIWPWALALGSVGFILALAIAGLIYVIRRTSQPVIIHHLSEPWSAPQIAHIPESSITPPAPRRHALARCEEVDLE